MSRHRFFLSVNLLVLALIVIAVMSLAIGNKTYALTNLLGNDIVTQIRLPRLLATLFVGILLSASGLMMQSMTQNPIAELSTLGISSGSSFALAILLGLGFGTSSLISLLAGALGAGLAFVLVVVLTARSRFNPLKTLLVGMSLSMIFTSLASSISFYTKNTQTYFMWLVGSFSGVTREKVWFMALVTLIFLAVIGVFGKQIKILGFGQELATSLGVNVAGVRTLMMILVVLASSIVVSSVGVISFVGLITPHIAKRLVRNDAHFGQIFILSSLLGMCLLSLSDFLARVIFMPYEFPVGAITMLLGAPFFLYLVRTTSGGGK
ncbi:FecCD family ABC transporter permease [Lactococcus insecticola]|uniref:Ferrichrome ABC transporter permease n=1 Tax=Pseudolactococcus insecticola TaxID=2709158 RepID=A0A6A0B568_9LACT|nr:iron ABC transporter permease [Lactococcus insecticola]GFH40549.1 ferrichrome ABC transporter permease [Lactococcus insecticola]